MKQLLLFAAVFLGSSLSAQNVSWPNLENISETKQILYTEFYDQHTIMIGGPDSILYFFDFEKLAITNKFEGLKGRPDAFAVSADGKRVFSASTANEFVIWEYPSGKIISSFGEYFPEYYTGKEVQLLPDGKTFSYTLGCDFFFRNAQNGTLLDSMKAPENDCGYQAAHSSTHKKVIVGGNNGIWVYDMVSATVVGTFNLPELSVITDVLLRPDGQQIAVAGRDGLILMDMNFKKTFKLQGHSDWINALRYSPDSKYLYSCSGTVFGTDRSLRIWDTQNGNQLASLEGHTDDVNTLAISPDGKYIVTASGDHSLKLWNVHQRKLIYTMIPTKVNGKMEMSIIAPDGMMYMSKEAANILKPAMEGIELSAGDVAKGMRKKKKKLIARYE